MNKLNPNYSVLYIGGDVLTFMMAFICSVFIASDNHIVEADWSMLFGLAMIWLVLGYSYNLYDADAERGLNSRLVKFLRVYLLLVVLVYLISIAFPLPQYSHDIIIATIICIPILGIPMNYLVINVVNFYRTSVAKTKQGRVKYALVAGTGNVAENIEKQLYNKANSDHKIKGYIKCKNEECLVGQDKVVGDLSSINTYLSDHAVDEIVIALPIKPSKKIRKIISAADYHGVRVKYIPDFKGLLGETYKVTQRGELVSVNVRQLPLDETYAFYIKNCFDIVFSMFAMVLLAPIFLVLAICIKLDSPGPVFYCPIRIGKDRKPFKVFKFRTMAVNDSSAGGKLSTMANDPRITRIGKFLRKYSIDEFPQFINVFLGEMSVVGPRPHRSYLNQQLQQSVDKYMIRHYFKPGITGWAQVNGWRGPTDTYEQKYQRTLHDIWYMEHWSLILDIKIIFLTILSRKVHKNAF